MDSSNVRSDGGGGSARVDQTNSEDDGDENPDSNAGDSSDSDLLKLPKIETMTPMRGQKCKASMMDQITDATSTIHNSQIKIAKTNTEEKTTRALEREKLKRQGQLNIELAQMNHQVGEAAAQRAHEIFMMDRQIQLEAMKVGHGGPVTYAGGGGGGGGGPGYSGGLAGAPFTLDPVLSR
jgi:hypothetical protein